MVKTNDIVGLGENMRDNAVFHDVLLHIMVQQGGKSGRDPRSEVAGKAGEAVNAE